MPENEGSCLFFYLSIPGRPFFSSSLSLIWPSSPPSLHSECARESIGGLESGLGGSSISFLMEQICE